MKNPLNKGQLKYVKWSLIVGGYAFCLKTLGNVVKERDEETTRANVISAMYGSLVDYVGQDVYNAWEAKMEKQFPLEETEMDNDSYLQEPMPEEEKAAELEEGEAIEIVAPMEGVDVTPAADADDASDPSRDENNG